MIKMYLVGFRRGNMKLECYTRFGRVNVLVMAGKAIHQFLEDGIPGLTTKDLAEAWRKELNEEIRLLNLPGTPSIIEAYIPPDIPVTRDGDWIIAKEIIGEPIPIDYE